MKALALTLLFATSAHAGGICADYYGGAPVSLGTTETTLWTQNIAGGSIPVGQSIEVTLSLQSSSQLWNQTANLVLYLNGQQVGIVCATGNHGAGWATLRITRTGNATARIYTETRTSLDTAEVIEAVHEPWEQVDLAWTQQQQLAVAGYSNLAGGADFLSACVQR